MKNDPVIQLLDQLLAGTSKVAAAEGPETGKTAPASEGARSSENSKDVKKQVPGQAVDNAGEASSVAGAGENTPTNSIGVKSGPTGEGVPATKTSLPDPGTSHPAKTGTEKYSSVSKLIDGANDIAARAVIYARTPKQAAVKAAELPAPLATAIAKKDKKDTKKPAEAPAEAPAAAEENGSVEEKMAAAVLSDTGDLTLEKKAALWDEMVGFLVGTETVDNLLKTAADQPKIAGMTEDEFTKAAQNEAAALFDAANTASTDLIHFLLTKQAEELPPEALAAAGVDPSAMGGGGLPAGAPADPAAGGGAQVDPAMLDQLIQALAAEGITPEDLIAAAEQSGGGGAPGGEPDGDEGPNPSVPSDGDGDALDDARSAALSEEGSDDDSEGAKKEASIRDVVNLVKLASKARSIKAAKARKLTKKATGGPGYQGPNAAGAQAASELGKGVMAGPGLQGPPDGRSAISKLTTNAGVLADDAIAGAGALKDQAVVGAQDFWGSLSDTQKMLLLGGGALGAGALGGYAAGAVGGKKKHDDE